MKYKQSIYCIILLFITLIGLWGIPVLVKKASYSPDKYPFVHYSSVLKELCFVDFKNKKEPLKTISNKIYSVEQFDSLMPLLNYRQLVVNGTMPDSIHGRAISVPEIRAKNVVFRFSPDEIQRPELGLYILFESMPKRKKLEVPDDVFRLKDKIEFIDAATNSVNEKKSKLFQTALEKAGFQFPAQWSSGDMNPRKPYDEGYFSLDSKGDLFHLKMVNARPYVKNTGIGKMIDIAHFLMYEAADKRFYGFLLDKKGSVYILENKNSKYSPLKLEIPTLNFQCDKFSILGNPLYWTLTIEREGGEDYIALDTESLKKVTDYQISRTPGKWDVVSSWLFPAYLTVQKKESHFLQPALHFTGYKALLLNVLLGIACVFLVRKSSFKERIAKGIFVLISGIAGLIAVLILKDRR